MSLFIVGLLVFLGTHSFAIATPAVRQSAVASLGEGRFKALYSLVSIAGFVLLIYGYGVARTTTPVLYTPPTATKHIALLLMLPVFPLLLATYLPGRIRATLKHPMLTAVKAWALAHLLANGTLADVLLFGGFLAWAVFDRISIKRRPDAKLPSGGPVINDIIAVVIGLALYVAFIFGVHQYLFGVPPIASLAY